jgi:hypothetical protein
MKESSMNNELFNFLLRIAANEALEQEIEEMPSCEQLNDQYKPSPALDKAIRKRISQYRHRKNTLSNKKTVLKVVASVVILLTLSGALLLNIEASRNYLFNAVIKWNEKYISIEHNDDVNYDLSPEIYRPTYLPKGFEELSSNITGNIVIIVYQNNSGIKITLRSSPSQSSNILIDNEEASYTNPIINGQTAYLFEATDQDKKNTLTWELDGKIFVLSSEIDGAELISVAESIKGAQ